MRLANVMRLFTEKYVIIFQDYVTTLVKKLMVEMRQDIMKEVQQRMKSMTKEIQVDVILVRFILTI